MPTGHFKMAYNSIRTSKWRSFLTMLGIVVGILSVVTIVSIGEGVKHDVMGQINHMGSDLLTVKPARSVVKKSNGKVSIRSFIKSQGNGLVSEADLKAISEVKGVETAVPVSSVMGAVSAGDKKYDQGLVLGTTERMGGILRQEMAYGTFFSAEDSDRNVAIIGEDVANELFSKNSPVGESMQIRGQTFVVGGVFEKFDDGVLSIDVDYNNAIFIPYGVAKLLNGGQAQIQEVFVRPASSENVDSTAANITAAIQKANNGQMDYVVLRQSDTMEAASEILNLLTGLIGGIAAISLLVGGIGIMNIMLVAVSERTHEIGVRKAIGATNGQIMHQFLVEAAMISVIGAFFGLLLSWVVNYFIRLFTDLKPIITWQIMLASVVVAVGVGIFFGVAPALKAARKQAITALRQY